MTTFIPPSPIKRRAIFLLQKAQAVGTRLGGLLQLAEGLGQLIDSIGWRLLRVRPLQRGDFPFQEDYTQMIDEANEDTATLHALLPQLANQGLVVLNSSEGQRAALQQDLQDVQAQLRIAQSTLTKETFTRAIGTRHATQGALQRGEVFVETFADSTHVDLAQSSGITVVPESQSVTLKRESEVNLAARVVPFIELLRDGEIIGFPGTTMEVETPQLASSPTDTAPTVTFVGANDHHGDLSTLFDNDPTTWFEFERCSLVLSDVPPQGPMVHSKLGGIFGSPDFTPGTSASSGNNSATETHWWQSVRQMGQSWIYDSTAPTQELHSIISPDTWGARLDVTSQGKTTSAQATKVFPMSDQPLLLTMTFTLSTPQAANYIEITPYIPSQATADCALKLRECVVVDEQQHATVVAPRTFLDALYLPIPAGTRAKYVRITIEQSQGYTALLGHPYLLAEVQTKTSHSFLGIQYSSSTKISYPRLKNADEVLKYNRDPSDAASALSAAGAVIGGVAGAGVFSIPGAAIGAVVGWVVGTIFGGSTEQHVLSTTQGVDVFLGKRWQIGLRSIGLKQIQYAAAGYVISQPYTFSQPVSVLRCSIDAGVPDGTQLQISCSTDNGASWVAADTDGMMLLPISATSVCLRIAFSRGADAGITPEVLGYTLEGYYA